MNKDPIWTEEWTDDDYCWLARKFRVLRAFIKAKGLEEEFMAWKRDKVKISVQPSV